MESIRIVVRIEDIVVWEIPWVVIVAPKRHSTIVKGGVIYAPTPTKWTIVYDVYIYPASLVTPSAMRLIITSSILLWTRVLVLLNICEHIIVLNALRSFLIKITFVVSPRLTGLRLNHFVLLYTNRSCISIYTVLVIGNRLVASTTHEHKGKKGNREKG